MNQLNLGQKIGVKMKDDGSHGVYNIGSQVKSQGSMIRPIVCD